MELEELTIDNSQTLLALLEALLLFDPRTYISGRRQPTIRGGLIWPRTNPFLFTPKSFYHPGLWDDILL